MGEGVEGRNKREGVEYGGRAGLKVHYAPQCGCFNLQKEGGNKVDRTTFAQGVDGWGQEGTEKRENEVGTPERAIYVKQ